MPREKAKLEAVLRTKGFKREDRHHHYYIYYSKDGLKTRAKTKTSHSLKMKDIPDNILNPMARQCYLTAHEFLNLIDCPMDRSEYETILITRGIFNWRETNDDL